VQGEYIPGIWTGEQRSDLKPLHISQPEGVSFTVEGTELRWQNWSMRLGFNYREGPVIYQVAYDDHGDVRDVAYRLSFAEMVVPYFREERVWDREACAKFLKDPELPGHLEALRDRWAALPEFGKEALEAALRALTDERGLKAAVLIHPTRMALSGLTAGPSLFDLVEVMGREATVKHLTGFVAFLRQAAPAAEG